MYEIALNSTLRNFTLAMWASRPYTEEFAEVECFGIILIRDILFQFFAEIVGIDMHLRQIGIRVVVTVMFRVPFCLFLLLHDIVPCIDVDCYAKTVGKEVESLTDDEIHTVVEKVAGVIDETLIETVMQGQQVSEIFGISKKIPQHEDFSEQLNQDKINFYNKWTHCKTKLGAPLLFSELSEDETTDIEGAKMFFANNPEEEQRYIFLRDEFAKTLNSTDKEIYYLSEKGLTQKEIADRLGYKTHSAVSKRMKIMNKDFKKFIGFEN